MREKEREVGRVSEEEATNSAGGGRELSSGKNGTDVVVRAARRRPLCRRRFRPTVKSLFQPAAQLLLHPVEGKIAMSVGS